MANPFVHIELTTDDVEKAKQFYGALFEWELKDVPEMSYVTVGVGSGTGGGMMKKPMPEIPTQWMPYVEVADCRASTAKARSLGAVVGIDCNQIPGMGTFSIIVDPTGARLGLWETARPPK